MKKPAFLNNVLVALILLLSLEAYAQTYKPFSIRKNMDIKGSMLVIGNNILGKDNLPFNDTSKDNQNILMQYIDIDSDASTFSSSSADLLLSAHEDGSATTCYRVAYAALYWGAILQSGSRTDINQVKFKLPGSTSYIDITGEVIYDAIVNPIIAETNEPGNTPYACYADVTNLLSGLSNIEGSYTMANINSSLGSNNSTGISAGWTLFVIYEDPSLHAKSFTSFDGFSHIYDDHQETVPVTGFTTPQVGNIDLQFAYATLDGDRTKRATKLEINGKEVTTPLRPANKFFGSVIENTNGISNPRNPFSTNTLGYDTGFLEIKNSEPEFIKNNISSADFRLQVARGQADPIFAFFAAFAVDIIEPDIDLTKVVLDTNGNNIDGDDVYLGQNLFYEITYQSVGSDNVTEFTIKDVLPDNIVFNPLTDIDLSNAGGATLLSYDPLTRTLIFKIPDSSVEFNDPKFVIRLAIQIVPNCYDLSQACSNEIINQAFATYRGIINTNWIQDEGSFASTECLGTPGSTNFLVNISNCNFQRTEVLCGESVILKAAEGYDSYSWSTSPTGSPVIGTGQTYTATATGTYYVQDIISSTCISIDEVITVIAYGNTLTNPVIPFADLLPACPNDGKILPYIFLCGANDTRAIYTGISDAVSIIWEQLDDTSCPALTVNDCANENDACTWNQVGAGSDYVANAAGQFRLVINYPGGCFSIFYFNVYQNLLAPTVMAKDILCTTPGKITVGGVPSGYEYSLEPNGPFQTSNVFTVNTPGYYVVYIKQIGVTTNPCIFETPSIFVRQRDFTVSTFVTQPYCNGDKGTIKLAANDALPQYFYYLYNGATLINSVGPIADSDYTFANLNPGTYTVTLETDDGCTYSENIVLIEPPLLTVTSALTKPITCTDGEITVYPLGGTPPYLYYVNSTTESQDSPVIIVTTTGVYDIKVVDFNNCSANTTITVDAIPKPQFNISKTDIACAGFANGGSITIDVTNANGNSLKYSIDGGVTFSNASVFTALSAGDYSVVVQYKLGSDVCVTDPQPITITVNSPITGTVSLSTPYTCTTNGTITVTGVTGGTPPYSYSIDGVTFQSGTTFTGLTNGTYSITAQDASACPTILGQITIEPLNPPTDVMFSSSAITCPSNTSTVTLTATGGVGTLEYQIIAPASDATAYQTSNVFAGLSPNTYTFQVKDENECIYNEVYTIAPITSLTVVGQHINDISCFGTSDGAVQFTVSGSTGFTYSVDGGTFVTGTSPITLSGLAAGTYIIIVKDNTSSCENTDSITVNGPSAVLAFTTNVAPITCSQAGSVVIDATGGWGNNSYSIALPDGTVLPEQSNNSFGNLSQNGSYTVTVKDANGCTITDTFNLSTPTELAASVSSTSDVCYDGTNGATLEVNVTSGQMPYEYSLNGGAFQSSNTFADLVPGTYTIVVRDAYGCTLTLPNEIIGQQLTANTVLTKDQDCTTSPEAIITGTISGGYAPFSYSVSINGGGYTSLGATGSPFTYSTSSPGTYQFQITDAKGCTALTGITTVNAISLPELNVVVQTQDILCHTDANGVIQVTYNSTVGTAPFEINVYNNTSNVDYGTQTTSLPAGSYTITLTDAKSCTDTETIVISEPDAISVNYHAVDITCETGGISQGSIFIDSVLGGIAPYNYFVTGTNGYNASELNASGTTSVSFNVVDFGLYQINVVDANGCSVLIQDVLVASPPTDLNIQISATVDCINGGEAVVSIGSTLPSAGPFFFSIYQGPSSVYPNPPGTWVSGDALDPLSATFTNLTPGVIYTFIVYDDSTKCSYYETALTPIPTNSTLTADAVSFNNITCNGSSDGNVTFTVNSSYSSATTIDYEIFDSQSLATTGIMSSGTVPANGAITVSDLGPLPFGNYYVLIKETSGPNAGCSVVTVPFNITESSIPVSLSANVVQNANCNLNSGVINAIAQDGTAPYQYQITTTPGSPLTSDIAWATASTFNMDAGSYYVHVKDAYGCIISSPVVVLPMDPSAVISAVINNQCTSTDGSFAIDVTMTTNGTAPYSFSIDGGAFQSKTTPFTISNLSSGNHTVEVKDANNCGNLVTVTIESPLGLTPIVSALPSCDENDGAITVTGAGGTGNYSYSISPNPASIVLTGNVFSGVPSGTYTVTLTDTATLCSKDVSVTLVAATPVTFTSSTQDVSCNGGNDGIITLNLMAGNDNPVYTYEITAPIVVPVQNSNIFTGLPAGTYTVKVNSGKGCSTTANVTIGEPTLLDVSGNGTDFECDADNSVNTSTITITEVGGTAPYTYSINGTNYFSNNTFEIIDNGSTQTINIFVKDANGCIATNSVILTPLPTITATAVAIATPIDCNNTGSVAINVTGGSGNFTYQMLPDGVPQASNIFNITTPGDYYFQVNDVDTGCTKATVPFTVAPFDTIDVVATPTSAITCFDDSDGAMEITVSGFNGNYNYQVIDNTGATYGSLVATNTTSDPQLITGLTGGSYTVVVTEIDSPFCSSTSNTVTIASPASALVVGATETSNVTCTNDQGTITATANGGWGSYEYSLTGAATVGYSTNGTFTNLAAGTYIILVRDANGCEASDTVTLVEPAPINATFTPSTTLLSCFGDANASISITNVTGGQGSNYTYTLNTILPTVSTSGPQISPVFGGLGAGTYSISINDGYNCSTTSLDIIITAPSQIQASLVKASSQTCLAQSTLTLSAAGGTGPYTYSDTSTFTTTLGSFVTSTIFSVPVGTYVYYVKDANGCLATVSNEITIEPLPELILNLDSTNATINCAGDNTGVIVATAQGGLGNYVYTLQDTLGNTISAVQDSPGVFTELIAGSYVVKVESGDCSISTAPINIIEPSAPLEVTYTVTDVKCFGGDNGAVEINATGGTGIIKYAISPQLNQFFETNLFENLAPGDYDVIVQDVLGCYLTFNFTIKESIPVIISIVPDSLFPEICEGDNDGEFSIVVSGGTAPYSVSLDDYDGVYTTGTSTQTQFDFTGLGGGDHSVFVRDSLGCESEWNITFPESVRINPLVTIDYECVDNSSANSVTVTVDESLTDSIELDYSLNGSTYQSSNIFNNVISGIGHYIDVRHTNGCIQRTELFDILEYQPLELGIDDGGLNEIVAMATGGSGVYEFTLNGESYGSTNTFIIRSSGQYTVTVTDSNGCTASATRYFEYIDICIPNYFTPNGDGVSDGWAPGCVDNYPKLEFDIFDRYGRKVATYRLGQYWDGKYHGKELPTGDYWYVVRLNASSDDREFVGHFTLYR